MKFVNIYVACSRGEADPCCAYPQTFEMDSLDEAIEFVKEENLDQVAEYLEEGEELTEADTEFFTETGKVEDVGWVECGEEGMNLVAPETSKWFERFIDIMPGYEENPNWDEETWKEFDQLLGRI